MRVIAVVPAYNEEKRIGQTLASIRLHVDNTIVVDDGSKDETSARAKEQGAMVYRHAVNRGQGAALKTGTIAAFQLGADVVVHLDADGQHDAHSLPMLIQPLLEKKADIVVGSRFLDMRPQGLPWHRRPFFWAARWFSAYFLGIPRIVSDPQNGLRAFTRQAWNQIEFFQDGMAHCSEILARTARSNLRWQEVPVRVIYSKETLAKGQRSWEAVRVMWHLLLGLASRKR